MSRLQLFLVLVAAHNYEAVSAGGCQVECGAGDGMVTVKGVDGLVVNGADAFSWNRAMAEASSSLGSAADELAKSLTNADNDVNAAFQDKRGDTNDRVESKLYTGNAALLGKINQHRQFAREERSALIQHLECNKEGRLWSEDRKTCMPAAVEFCGAIPIDGVRAKVLHDCVGIKGTECETHCPAGWSGEAVTYFCTGSKDMNGGWQRIKAHGSRSDKCHNVDECAYPDYPCNSRAYTCTDTEGSFECACHFSMVESAEKASNGRGKTCECPNLSWWQFVADVTPFCTCPYGGDVAMEVNSAGVCACPDEPADGSEYEVLEYPDEHFLGSVSGVRNQNPENLNYGCLRSGAAGIIDFSALQTVPDESAGFTLALNIDTSDGNVLEFTNDGFWQSPSDTGGAKTDLETWMNNDFKDVTVYSTTKVTSLLMVIHDGASPKPSALGWRMWTLDSPDYTLAEWFSDREQRKMASFTVGGDVGSLRSEEPMVHNNNENDELWANCLKAHNDYNRMTALKVNGNKGGDGNLGWGLGTHYDWGAGSRPQCDAQFHVTNTHWGSGGGIGGMIGSDNNCASTCSDHVGDAGTSGGCKAKSSCPWTKASGYDYDYAMFVA